VYDTSSGSRADSGNGNGNGHSDPNSSGSRADSGERLELPEEAHSSRVAGLRAELEGTRKSPAAHLPQPLSKERSKVDKCIPRGDGDMPVIQLAAPLPDFNARLDYPGFVPGDGEIEPQFGGKGGGKGQTTQTARRRKQRDFKDKRVQTDALNMASSGPTLEEVARRAVHCSSDRPSRGLAFPRSAGESPPRAAVPTPTPHFKLDCRKKACAGDSGDEQEATAEYDFFLVPTKSAVAQVMLSEGISIQEKVRDKGKGHSLGHPHVHVAFAMMESLMETAPSPHKEILQAWHSRASEDRRVVFKTFKSCRAVEAWPGTKNTIAWHQTRRQRPTKIRDEDHGHDPDAPPDNRLSKIMITWKPLADWSNEILGKPAGAVGSNQSSMMVEVEGAENQQITITTLRRALHVGMHNQAADLIEDTAPKSELGRVVGRQMKGLQRKEK
jgi:hypothetical protein